jgi:hypothetical protein
MRVLDLFVEFRCMTNGVAVPAGNGLLGALAYFGLDSLTAVEKESMRELALRGGPWTVAEKQALLEYCESDVIALERLLDRMRTEIDPRAILRGRYMAAAARIEYCGVPIDARMLDVLRRNWQGMKERLIERVDRQCRVYEGGAFRSERWGRWLAQNDIPWPVLATGRLALDDDTFAEMARRYPVIGPIKDLRYALSQMRLEELAVGPDHRNRCLLSAFRARTGRNQPSNSKFIFGPAVWLRGLIKPEQGRGLAYIDWSQQEFGIAAALSRDPAMMAAYQSGDPYLAFAKQAGAVPADATKKSHGPARDQFKACVLGVQYSMGAESLAEQINQPVARGRELLAIHRETYPVFWAWSDAAVDHAMLYGSLQTVFGWRIFVGGETNPRSLRNFPMQGNGAEMLRLACSLATERGVSVCAPVHDALLIEAPLDELDQAVALAQDAMREASALVLGGFELRSDPKVVRYPDRYQDERGREMWNAVQDALAELGVGCA